MTRSAFYHGAVVVLAIAVFFTNLGAPRLWDRDEPRNAGCAWEMQQRGDRVVPVFNGELRPHKPALLYWLMMSAYSVFGVNEFSARLPSAALSVGTIWLTFATARRLFGEQVAFWSGAILSTATMFCISARAATPDATLVFLTTASLAMFVRWTFDSGGQLQSPARMMDSSHWPFPAGWWKGAGIYGIMGIATLAKGPVGLVLPTAVIGMFCLIQRLPAGIRGASTGRAPGAVLRGMLRPFEPLHFLRTCWAMRPVTAIIMVLVVAGPWYCLVGLRTEGDWLIGFLGEHNVGRALTPMEGHGGPFFYYLLAILIGMFPWSVLAVPTWLHHHQRLREGRAQHSGTILIVCWVAVYVALFTLARTKLPSYVVPAYPALAMLIGQFVVASLQTSERTARVWVPVGLAVLGGVGVAATIGLALAGDRYLAGNRSVALIGLLPVLVAAAALACWFRAQRQWAFGVFLTGAVVQAMLAFAWLSVAISQQRTDLALLRSLDADGSRHPLATFSRLEPSWVFYAGRTIAAFDPTNLDELRTYIGEQTEPYVITTLDGERQLRAEFGGQWDRVADAAYFLRREHLVVLRPRLETGTTLATRAAAHELQTPK